MTDNDCTEKQCTKCKKIKPIELFYWTTRRSGKKARHSVCQECRRYQFKVYAKTKRGKELKRAGILKRKYNVTAAEYDEMLESQNGVCAICFNPETKIHRDGAVCMLALDHDHATGEPRGLLCSACNMGIGLLKDDADLLISAINYLKLNGARRPGERKMKPFIGMTVHYRPKSGYDDDVVLAGTVAFVNGDNTVNLGVLNQYGVHESEQNVKINHDLDTQLKPGQCQCDSFIVDHLLAVELEIDDLQSGETKGPETGAIGDAAETDTTAEQDIEQGMGSGAGITGSHDGTDESADVTASTDDGVSAEATEEAKVGEEVTESAALMGLKAHAGEVDVLGARFLNEDGEVITEGTEGCFTVTAVFVDDVEFNVTFDEWKAIDDSVLTFQGSEVS